MIFMKIEISGSPKEIAELAMNVQVQQEKRDVCMNEYLFFTMRCIMDTIVNVMTFIGSLCGDAGSVEAAK